MDPKKKELVEQLAQIKKVGKRPSTHPLYQRMKGDFTDEEMAEYKTIKGYGNLETFRVRWIERRLQVEVKEFVIVREDSKVDEAYGQFLPFPCIVQKEGGRKDESAVKAAMTHAFKCITMGSEYLEWNDMTDRLEFFYSRRRFRNMFRQSWIETVHKREAQTQLAFRTVSRKKERRKDTRTKSQHGSTLPADQCKPVAVAHDALARNRVKFERAHIQWIMTFLFSFCFQYTLRQSAMHDRRLHQQQRRSLPFKLFRMLPFEFLLELSIILQLLLKLLLQLPLKFLLQEFKRRFRRWVLERGNGRHW
jgi:hypothetical protein